MGARGWCIPTRRSTRRDLRDHARANAHDHSPPTGASSSTVHRAPRRKSPRGFLSHLPVYREPPADVAAKVGRRRPRDERSGLTDPFAAPQSASDHAQRAEARLGELEDGRRSAVDISIHEAHLGADITPRVPGQFRDTSRAIVPAKSRQSDAPRISSHQEWCVCWTCNRRKRGCDRGELSFFPQRGECRQVTAVDGASERIRSHSIRYDHDYLSTITWRALCRRTQL